MSWLRRSPRAIDSSRCGVRPPRPSDPAELNRRPVNFDPGARGDGHEVGPGQDALLDQFLVLDLVNDSMAVECPEPGPLSGDRPRRRRGQAQEPPRRLLAQGSRTAR